jgi:WD40 repeat protein
MIVHNDPDVSGQPNVLTRFEVEGPARDIYLLSARDIVGRIFVTDSRLIYFDGGASGFLARLWDYESEPQTITFEYPGDLRARAVTPDGRFLVLCAGDGSVKVYDLQARQKGASFEEHKTRVYEVVIAPDGHTIISVSEDGVAFMWDLHTAQQKERSFNVPNQTEIKAITADNQWAFVASPRSALVQIPLESTAGTDIRSLDGHTAAVYDVAVSPDGDRVLSASEDRTIQLWSLQSGEQLAAAVLDQPARRAVFAEGGDLIMAGDAAGNVYCLRYSRPTRIRQREFQRKRKGPEISGNDEESL